MAVTKKNAAAKTGTSEMKKADAFLNLKIQDNQGNVYNLPKGLPLFLDNRVTQSIILAAQANPDREFVLTGSVWFPSDEPAEPIEL